jgi:CrcB protein
MVFLGGAMGCLFRYSLSPLGATFFPFFGTMLANFIGSFLVGTLYWRLKPGDLRLFLITGFLGGLTTLSSFSAETLDLLKQDQYLQAFFYFAFTTIGSIALVFLGVWLSKMAEYL